MKTGSRKTSGVTLIELMIVIVVVAILATVAYPNYREYAARAKRSEAKAALLKIATNQERIYLQNNSYTSDLRQLGFNVASDYVTDSGSYRLNVTSADSNNFSATATYVLSDREVDKCASFTIDGRGKKTSLPRDDCWHNTR